MADLELRKLLGRSRAARVVLRLLRQADLSVPELAMVTRGIGLSPKAISRAVLELRRLGRVAWTGRWIEVPSIPSRPAKIWRSL
jgi:hypothetical protein